MSDTMDYFRDLKHYRRTEAATKRAAAEALLTSQGISYTVHNNGAHIVIEEGGATFDYWPGTERWRMRPRRGQLGVQKLLVAVRERKQVNRDLDSLGRANDAAYVAAMERAYPHLKGEPQ